MLLLEGAKIFQKITEDNEFALYTVTLFWKVADSFKTSARERGFLVSTFLISA
jgi:hypothetical protein